MANGTGKTIPKRDNCFGHLETSLDKSAPSYGGGQFKRLQVGENESQHGSINRGLTVRNYLSGAGIIIRKYSTGQDEK